MGLAVLVLKNGASEALVGLELRTFQFISNTKKGWKRWNLLSLILYDYVSVTDSIPLLIIDQFYIFTLLQQVKVQDVFSVIKL